MKASKRPAKGLAARKPSVQAQAKSRRALDKFKAFAAATIRDLERGERMVAFLHVARGVDPCPKGPPPSGNLYVSFQSQMIKGPPYFGLES